MNTYTVVATIQSKQPGNDPVEVQWYSGPSEVSVLGCMAQLMERVEDDNPFSPVLRSVTVTVTEDDK